MKVRYYVNAAVVVLLIGLIAGPAAAFQQGAVPTPESVIGFKPGTDYKMASWDKISLYFRTLAQASDRIMVSELGETTMGNPMIMAVISSSANLQNIERIKEIQHLLADPRKTSGAELPRLVREGKTVVLITCSLHASELGAAQMSPILAYELVTEESEITRRIRDNVMLVLFPSANPDGVNIVHQFYTGLNPGPGVEVPSLPRLYHYYVGHDNNRDWYMLTQKETKLIAHQLYNEWIPEIVLDMHQMGNSGARFFLPPFDDPLNPLINPIIVRELQLIGGYFNTGLIAGGYPWVQNQNNFSMWWHGGMRTAPYFHNIVGILSEAASANLASPVPPRSRTGEEFQVPIPMINYPIPWKHDRSWTIGDIVEQDRVAARALLKAAALNKDMFLNNFYRMNKEAIEKGRTEVPFAYVMPAGQHDPGALRYFLEIMLRQKTEFHVATASFNAGGKRYPEGSIIAYLAQPSRAHVEGIFGTQIYPDAARRPYDITGWTLPLQMGVQYDRIERSFSAQTRPFTEAKHFTPGETVSRPASVLIGANSIDHYKAVNILLEKGHKMKMLTEPGTVGNRELPPGTKVLEAGQSLSRDLDALKDELTFELVETDRSVSGDMVNLNKPRIAMTDDPRSMPVGWMRWIMDTHGFEYDLIGRDGVIGEDLHDDFDIVIMTAPLRAAERSRRQREWKDIPADITANLRDFLKHEGTIAAWGENANYVIAALDLPIERAPGTGDDTKFSVPGSVLKINVQTGTPYTFGMQEDVFVFYGSNSTAWYANTGNILGKYLGENPLVSGFVLGPKYIQETPCVIELPVEKGTILLIGFDPVFRAQPVGTFKLIFNAILYSAASD